ncbi:hypothetical protein T235_11010 [Tannerella sp. oral taxon BU063 isolate Cell 8/11]|uniref:Tetratricopeptide repeat protein n=1 Tax=Tannerella sp. oral taxon BU063 isolate Cell 8/11 TaxID=1411915 RepID=W2CYU6_9BACT|nr:hypothetical protein T235_11010 [Tannerella sp. oral taxon BU063 isolate Cell 8/11]
MEVMTCRYIGLIGVFISVFFFSSCDSHRANREMKQAEEMMAQNPDSARAMLENIGSHHLMNEKSYAHWCMLLGRVRDEQQKKKRTSNPLSTRQWLKAQAYYDRKGTPREQAEIRLYTGRSQKDDGEYDAAVDTYKDGLSLVAKSNDYSLAGYLSSYLADLYFEKRLYGQAQGKYDDAASFHARSGNLRSQALALRDAAYCYFVEDKMAEALFTLQKADSIIGSTGDSTAIRAIFSDFGVFYGEMGMTDKAEMYLAANINSNDPWPTYLALADVYIKKKEYGKAREYTEKAVSETTKGEVLRLHYLIEKSDGSPSKAIDYLEQYIDYLDSTYAAQNRSHVYEVEQRYDKSQLENENIRLQVAILYRTLAIIILSVCAAIGILLFRRVQKLRLDRQQEALQQKENEIRFLTIELNEMKSALNERQESEANAYKVQREKIISLEKALAEKKELILQSSTVGKKVVRVIRQGAAAKVSLSARDWTALEGDIKSLYPQAYAFFTGKIKTQKSSAPWKLCLLSFFNSDTKVEAFLLGLTDDIAARQCRYRLRKDLGVDGSQSLAVFLRSLG